MKHPHVYRALLRHGHSPTKAFEILLDARRGERWALNWVKTIARIARHA